MQVWSQYIARLKEEGKQNIASIMEMNSPEIREESIIHFTLANALNKVN